MTHAAQGRDLARHTGDFGQQSQVTKMDMFGLGNKTSIFQRGRGTVPSIKLRLKTWCRCLKYWPRFGKSIQVNS